MYCEASVDGAHDAVSPDLAIDDLNLNDLRDDGTKRTM